MSDVLSRQLIVLLGRLNNLLRFSPHGLEILPNTAYRRYRPFRREDRNEAAAIVADVKAFLPGQAVLIERAMERFYGTIDRGSMPPDLNDSVHRRIHFDRTVLNPLKRCSKELETMLTEVRDWLKKSILGSSESKKHPLGQ